MVICLERGADLHIAQLMPLPLTVSCFSKIQIGLPCLVPAYLDSPGKGAIKRVCVCVRSALVALTNTHAWSEQHSVGWRMSLKCLDSDIYPDNTSAPIYWLKTVLSFGCFSGTLFIMNCFVWPGGQTSSLLQCQSMPCSECLLDVHIVTWMYPSVCRSAILTRQWQPCHVLVMSSYCRHCQSFLHLLASCV